MPGPYGKTSLHPGLCLTASDSWTWCSSARLQPGCSGGFALEHDTICFCTLGYEGITRMRYNLSTMSPPLTHGNSFFPGHDEKLYLAANTRPIPSGDLQRPFLAELLQGQGICAPVDFCRADPRQGLRRSRPCKPQDVPVSGGFRKVPSEPAR